MGDRTVGEAIPGRKKRSQHGVAKDDNEQSVLNKPAFAEVNEDWRDLVESLGCPRLLLVAAFRRDVARKNVAAVLLSLNGINWMLGLHLNLEECVW